MTVHVHQVRPAWRWAAHNRVLWFLLTIALLPVYWAEGIISFTLEWRDDIKLCDKDCWCWKKEAGDQ